MTKKELIDRLSGLLKKLQGIDAGGDAEVEIEAPLETCDSVFAVVGVAKGKVYIFKDKKEAKDGE